MPLFNARESALAKAIGSLNYTDPFSPERLARENEILGLKSVGECQVWHNTDGCSAVNDNLKPIFELTESLVNTLRRRIHQHPESPSPDELALYDQLVIYWLFEKYRLSMCEHMLHAPQQTRFQCYVDFHADFEKFIPFDGRSHPTPFTPDKSFAMFFQIHRAFYHIFDFIAGGSFAAARLRSQIWQSIFTYDIYRYHRTLFDKMNQVTTIITGESGTGKELVARAIALSQYIPFDASSSSFVFPYPNCFQAVQLSAMPPTMIESELFGHVKGAFTGAIAEHKGYLEECSPFASIFLDEIGEVVPEVQVKLLRLLQSRTFQRIGDVRQLVFKGKIIAATNRDLLAQSGNVPFRNDLYYRLCADKIETVPLRQLLNHDESELRQFVMPFAKRIIDGSEAEQFAQEACDWIVKNIGMDYGWPGNVRELEQCLRNLLIHGRYEPHSKQKPPEALRKAMFRECGLSADLLLREYMTALLEKNNGNIAKAAAEAGVDRRTIKKYTGIS